MKHKKTGRKFSREKKQREAMIKIMLGDLLLKRRITTTLAKAKELKMIAEKIIGRTKKPESLRYLKLKLPQNIDLKTLRGIALIAAPRESGYLRVIKKGRRLSDSAPMAILEIIDESKKSDKEKA
ncbi:MAG: L17 family ribosomal protein [Parcubacteria group bacterium]|jgi:large subunit ribosomal protein L17